MLLHFISIKLLEDTLREPFLWFFAFMLCISSRILIKSGLSFFLWDYTHWKRPPRLGKRLLRKNYGIHVSLSTGRRTEFLLCSGVSNFWIRCLPYCFLSSLWAGCLKSSSFMLRYSCLQSDPHSREESMPNGMTNVSNVADLRRGLLRVGWNANRYFSDLTYFFLFSAFLLCHCKKKSLVVRTYVNNSIN